MTLHVSRSEVFQALSQVRHPEIRSRNLVELGMIPEVIVEGTQILVILALPVLDAPVRQGLVDAIRRTVMGLADGLEIEVRVMEMNEAQRTVFQSALKEELKVSPKPGVCVRRVLAVMSGKGGVGKSSVAALLSSSLRKRGFKVGVLDADITGPSIPKLFGVYQLPIGGPEGILPIESRTGIKLMSINFLLPDEDQPVVWRGPLISRAIQQFWSDIAWGDLDVLVVDLPPGTSDASLTVMQALPLDGIVLVTSPQDLAGMVVRKAANMATGLGVRLIGLVENMNYILCPQCGAKIELFGPSRAEDTARWIGTSLLGHLPLDPQLSILCDEGAIEAYHSPAFEQITDRVVEFAPISELEPFLKRERE
ncbi:MAG: Mrp/NBP35 family ATP-binding protein [Anaerolineales bacterium]|jgi:Mrp family chromosome partitioning ATPase